MPTGVIEILYDEPSLSQETLRKVVKLLVSAKLASMGAAVPGELIDAVYALGDNPSPEAWRELVVGLAVRGAARLGLNVTRDFAEAVYDLGPRPSDEDYEALASKIAEEKIREIMSMHPPPRFPEDIPREIRGRMINKNGTIMLLSVAFQPGYTSRELARATEKLQDLLSSVLEKNGLADVERYFTGPPAFSLDLQETTKGDVERIDKVTVILVVVLLASLLASIVAPMIPLVTVGVAMALALAALYLEGRYVIDIPYYIRNMITPILMGVGVDYSIYMLYRFREELDKGRSRDEATEEAVTFAGEAIVSAAFTVIVGFGALAASDFKMLRSMGFSLALAILLVLVAALTLTATILSLLGARAFWPYKP
ncbi:MAG: MMPL family transporter, partial [Candidatus Korarchaeota archaeon]|nr:MMPL family transporter [Candidatus Korarchaeota archaeon]